MTDHGGNKALAGDIVVEVMSSLSEAVVSAFQWCDDLDIPLSQEQKKQIFNAYISVVLDMRDKVRTIIELDDIARDFVGESDKVKEAFQDMITMDIETKGGFSLED